nr:xylulose kinase-1 [Tanacetum cinerariifolium]
MMLTFVDTHNMIAHFTQSDASEGFNQIMDFLNASSIKYALTVNPNIYVSVIKQFWTYVSVKTVNDVQRLQTLVDKKKVIITEATIRDALRLDDGEGIDCLPNEEIFTELERMSEECGHLYPILHVSMIPAIDDKGISRKWFYEVDTPLFEGMLVAQHVDESVAEVNVDDVPAAGVADEGVAEVNVDDVLAVVDEPSIPSPTPSTQPPPPSQDIPSTS